MPLRAQSSSVAGDLLRRRDCRRFVEGEVFGELVPGSRSRVLRLEMIGERVSSSAGLCIRGGAGRPWDVRVARATAKMCEHPYVRVGRCLHLWSGAWFGLWVDVETAAAR